MISSLSLDISIKKASDSDGVDDEESLIFSAVCCNVLVVLTKPRCPPYWFQIFPLPTWASHLQITVFLLVYVNHKVV